MRQAFRILPVYTGDVSGVCSALYELGGMVVMHDPSGCNSTYNTHDETRWYDRDSLIFLSGLCAPDAIMGNDSALIDSVVAAAQEYRPQFITLCNSPIPYLNGTDFAGICRVIEEKTGISSFYIPTNGMHDYVNGAGLAFEKLAARLFDDPSGEKQTKDLRHRHSADKRSVNILGMTPLDHAAEGACSSLKNVITEGGWQIESVWAMDDTLENLRRAGNAAVNLVVSADGLRTALFLRKRFGTPWVAGMPVGSMRERVMKALEKAADEDLCGTVYSVKSETHEPEGFGAGNRPSVIVIGEPVISCSIATDLENRGFTSCVIATTEESASLIRPCDRICLGEEEVESVLEEICSEGTLVIADPLYQYVIPEGTMFEPCPHLAFSGRLYRNRFIDPLTHTFAKGVI